MCKTNAACYIDSMSVSNPPHDPGMCHTAYSYNTPYSVLYGWPGPYKYGVYPVFLAGKSQNIRSYTGYIHGSGQPYVFKAYLTMVFYRIERPKWPNDTSLRWSISRAGQNHIYIIFHIYAYSSVLNVPNGRMTHPYHDPKLHAAKRIVVPCRVPVPSGTIH